MSEATVQTARPSGRSTLLVPHSPEEPCGRDALAAMARSGMRGLLVERPVRLSTTTAAATARFLHLLVEAAGAGLRVYWEGDVGDLPRASLQHLDPPRHDGVPEWPVPREPLLTHRRGPGFLLLEDLRDPAAPRRWTVPDHPWGRVLRAYATPTAPDPADREALAVLEAERLVLRLGGGDDGLCLALPVRFAYARS
ncbi:DUF5825 family protein [Streptomyces sp. UH6]|uniref:DUF5825 family protein n=1 Tax=Streptomyces sp. UH6 TaxID=2748379 RepID=UPI0015D48030|nr:DUF5825 family protein [Streptomyces sp. UH6]NYV73723.1 hypothetical protein [Streptomyces sp. UH6]